ncbi:MAG: hypothetical protein JWP74_3478 [Marmoricola sp.]|nr:hypothetical protein [Marmoricola sp.]
MALGESQLFCPNCNRPVLSVRAGLANTAHCPNCGYKFKMKDYYKSVQLIKDWQARRRQ